MFIDGNGHEQRATVSKQKPMDVDVMAECVREWAEVNKPKEWAASEEIRRTDAMPKKYRACIRRLVEIRWAEDPDWRLKAPLRALEETSIVAIFRLPIGEDVEVAGRYAIRPETGETRVWGWAEVAKYIDEGWDLKMVLAAKRSLDLAVQEGQPYPVTPYVPPVKPPAPAVVKRSGRRQRLAAQENMQITDPTKDQS
jgi:hypothetical protein